MVRPGAHISALLLRMFIMYFPQMIKAGMVYKAIPPLYSIKMGNKEKYFTDQMEFVKYNQRNFSQKYAMTTTKGVKLTTKEMNVFFMTNTDYVYYLEKCANTYAVNPYLLEMVLNNYVENKKSINFSKLQKEVESKYRFMKVTKEKKNIVIKGVIEKSQIIIATDKFFFDCRDIINIIENNKSLYYKINGKKCSIYDIMALYDKLSPNGLQRYKGLGEMDADQLAESTLYPGSDRTLVRYTLEDAKEELEAIRDYESNPKKILNLVGNVTRDDLLD